MPSNEAAEPVGGLKSAAISNQTVRLLAGDAADQAALQVGETHDPVFKAAYS